MPGDIYRKPLPGTPLAQAFPSKLLGKMIDAAHGEQFDRRGNVAQHFKQSGIVKVRNDTGEDLDRFNIVGLGEPLVTAAASIDEFKRRPTFSGEDPTAAHAGKFGVLLEPLKQDAIGDAVVSGVVQVQVEVETEGHTYAEVGADTEALVSVGSGSAQILWVESGTGTKWAIVRLGRQSDVLGFFKVTGPIDTGFHPAERYVADADANDFELADPGETAWLYPSAGELLTKRVFYPCKFFGVHTDGLCIYVPMMFQQKVRGVLDGALAYQGSATLSVYGNSGGSGATATSTITGDAVTSVTVTAGGTNYEWTPAVTFTGGGGTGAAGTATISAAGVVTGVTVTSGGSGYTSEPTVAFSARSDTGLNITINDGLLMSGQSVAAGKFVTAFYDLAGREWTNDGAQCVTP